MNNHFQDEAKKRLSVRFDDLPEREHRVRQRFGEPLHVSLTHIDQQPDCPLIADAT